MGKCQMYAIALNDFDTLQVDLFANMEIVSIQKNKEDLSFYRQHNAVFIEIPKMIKDELFEIVVKNNVLVKFWTKQFFIL